MAMQGSFDNGTFSVNIGPHAAVFGGTLGDFRGKMINAARTCEGCPAKDACGPGRFMRRVSVEGRHFDIKKGLSAEGVAVDQANQRYVLSTVKSDGIPVDGGSCIG